MNEPFEFGKPTKLAIRLRFKRKQSRISLRQLAGTMGLPVSFIHDLEHGRAQFDSDLVTSYKNALNQITKL